MTEYESFTVVKLRALLKEKGLNTAGLKADLVQRLKDHDANREAATSAGLVGGVVGATVGAVVGAAIGGFVGATVGASVGGSLGASVGAAKRKRRQSENDEEADKEDQEEDEEEQEEEGEEAESKKQKTEPEGDKKLSCIVHNDTDKEIAGCALMLNYKLIGGGGSGSSVPYVPAHGKTTIELPNGFMMGRAVDQTSGQLKLGTKGLVFADNSNTVSIVDGGEYHIKLDEVVPLLSDSELKTATQVLRDHLEGAYPGASIKDILDDRKSYSKELHPRALDLLRTVAKEIGREEIAKNEDALKKLIDMILESSATLSSAKFFDVYSNHPRKPELDTSVSAKDIQTALKQGKAKVVVYYRALDRFPGGNCDSFVVKYTIDQETEKTTAVKWCDWDGTMYFTKKPASFPRKAASFKKHTVPALCELAEKATDGSLEFAATVDDKSCDSDEYDTEWTSIEVLVYLPHQQKKHDETKPVLHIHQYSVYPSYRTGYGKEKEEVKRIKPTPQFTQVVESLEEVFHMERPEQFSDGGEAHKLLGDNTEIFRMGYFYPIYLN